MGIDLHGGRHLGSQYDALGHAIVPPRSGARSALCGPIFRTVWPYGGMDGLPGKLLAADRPDRLWSGSEANGLPLHPLSVPADLAGVRPKIYDTEAATVRVPQRLRNIALVLFATPAWTHVFGILYSLPGPLRRLGQQFVNGHRLTERVPGPGQLLHAAQFGCPLQKFGSGECVAGTNARGATTPLAVLFVVLRHWCVSFGSHTGRVSWFGVLDHRIAYIVRVVRCG